MVTWSLHRSRLLLLCGLGVYLVLNTYILLSQTPGKTRGGRGGGGCGNLPAIFCPPPEDDHDPTGLKRPVLSTKPKQNNILNDVIRLKNKNDQSISSVPQEQPPHVPKRRTDQTPGGSDSQHVSKRRALPPFSSRKIESPPLRLFPPLYRPMLQEGVNCSRLWRGDAGEVQKALRSQSSVLPARRPVGFYQSITSNCQLYRQRAGYIESSSEEERKFPLAFSVMVYKDMEQVERLLRAVYRPHNAYCLHLDLKASPQLVQDLQSLTQCLPNVLWSDRRLDVQWGSFSVLQMELVCMESLWKSKVGWRYLINLTGQEFPLKTNKELVRILKVYRGANDILGEIPKERNKWRWRKAGNPPHNISVAKGPVHVAASRGFVDFVLHSKQAQDFLTWTKRTGIPDETFFATINNMHQFGVPGSYTGNLTARQRIMLNRFKIWDVTNRTCSGRFVRHICHFGPQEVAVLARSRHLVANKFTYDLHPLAWDCTEQWYFERVRREEETGRVEVDTEPYRRLLIVQNALRPDNSPWG